MRAIAWLVSVAALAPSMTPALADTLYCSTWRGIRTCSSPDGYVSHESQWQGMTTGDDNRGNRWTTSHWQGFTTTTVTRRRRNADARRMRARRPTVV